MRVHLQFLSTALALLGLLYAHGVALAQCDCGMECTCTNCPYIEKSYKSGRWFVVESESFQICCDQSEASARQLAGQVEKLRAELNAKWLDQAEPTSWSPKCQIAVHSSRQSYTAAVGRGSERTVGSSRVKIDKGCITERRIDLFGGNAQYMSVALPHEMTHVVLRDRFATHEVPRWADEGAAILADAKDKRERHQKDLREAVSRGTTFSVASLVSMEGYPPSDRWGAFYGESASLTRYLVERKCPVDFVNFVECAGAQGYDVALQKYYGIDDLADLDRQWRRQLSTEQSF